MRSIGTLAVVTGMLVLASACGDGGGTPPPDNTPPTAGFTHSCNALACTFTSTSTDVAPGTIVTHVWAFGDGGTANGNNPSHSYSVTTPTDFTVTLTVTDNEGDSDVETQTITVTPATPVNTPPTAGFNHTCSAVDNAAACIFISTSTDVPPGTIATHAWTFGDGATSDVSSPSHSYAITVPTDFTVTLTVTDNEGATAVATQTVTGVPVNTPPVAAFTHECNLASKCTFTNTSTDLAPGTIATYAWTFGDGGTADVSSPSHVYAIPAPADFTVTLTVTDDAGATAVATQRVTATPPPPGAEGCTTVSATRLECAFNVTARSTIKLKLLAISCDLSSKITAPPPIGDQVFLGVCARTVGQELGIFGGPEDQAIVYEAGSQVRIRYDHGNADADDPDLGPPTATFSGTYPDWTINFEDGDHQGAAGEPDFTDIVLGVHATEVF